jgi:hypothetical protein
MPDPTDKEIMERAYLVWERSGRPVNREEEFWPGRAGASQRG